MTSDYSNRYFIPFTVIFSCLIMVFVQEVEALRVSTSRLEERLADEKEGRKVAEGHLIILNICLLRQVRFVFCS